MLTSKLLHGPAQPLMPMDHQSSLNAYITNIGEAQVAEEKLEGEMKMLLLSKHSRVHEYLDDQLRTMAPETDRSLSPCRANLKENRGLRWRQIFDDSRDY